MPSFSSKSSSGLTSTPARETVFDVETIESKSGFSSIAVSGKGARHLFRNEAGGHRWMHSSPTDKRGRVHTSTITVAVLEPLEFDKNVFDLKDVDIVTTRGSGPGGQNRNKVESCVVATHTPTGITVRVDMRDQHQSKSTALQILSARIVELSRQSKLSERHATRKEQQGCGSRGDKVRTYREIDDQVTDHRTNQKWSLKKWMKGDW